MSSHRLDAPLHCFISWWKTWLMYSFPGYGRSGLRQVSSPDSGLLQFAMQFLCLQDISFRKKLNAPNGKKKPTKPKYVFHTGRILYKGIAMQKVFFFKTFLWVFRSRLLYVLFTGNWKGKTTLSRMEVEFMSRSSGFMRTWQIYGGSVIIQMSKVLLKVLVSYCCLLLPVSTQEAMESYPSVKTEESSTSCTSYFL